MDQSAESSGQVPQARPHRLNFGAYVALVVVLYLGNLGLGVGLLLTGFSGSTFSTNPCIALSSILDWVVAWVLCYLAYRRSHTFGYVLLGFTIALTILFLVALFFVVMFVGLMGSA